MKVVPLHFLILLRLKPPARPFCFSLFKQEIWASGFANNKGADKPVHPHRLISAFVKRFLESIKSKLATAEETGLRRFVGNLEDRFCRLEAHFLLNRLPVARDASFGTFLLSITRYGHTVCTQRSCSTCM